MVRTTVATRVLVAVAACAVALLGVPALARADRDYRVAFTANQQGDITGTGNTLLTCFNADPLCAAARNGTASGSANNNNERPMTWVDVDDDSDTFNSSAATLKLPAGARVVSARLYYTGRLQQGADSGVFKSRPAPNPARRDTVLFRPPGLGSYLTLRADTVDDANDPQTHEPREYQGIVDVTDIVRAAGAGEYTVANVQLGTGLHADQAGGWALAVAYEDATQPTRNLTIFDGFRFVLATGPAVDIPLSGFLTPPSGPDYTNLGLVAIEGDLGTTGDSATINAGTAAARPITNATNPANNVFNSSISDRRAQPFVERRPAYSNQLGFDADIIDETGALANNQTSTVIRLATNGDGFAPNGVSFATDLYAPSLNVTKSVTPAGDARLGDVLTYRVGVTNTGLDAAENTVLRDEIPQGTAYVRNSLRVVSGANAGTKSDAVGDDQAEFDETGDAVVFRLGSGANGASGGELDVPSAAPANATEIEFQVRIASGGLPSGFKVTNSAGVGFRSETLDQPGHVTSPDVVTPVRIPDLKITKRHEGAFVAGGRVPFTLTVRNVGDAPTFGRVDVTDALPAALRFATRPSGDGWDCSDTTDRVLHCSRTDVLAPGDAYPDIRYVARVSVGASDAELMNSARVTTPGDGDPTNDVDTDTGPVTAVDLAIHKFALTRVTFPGRTVSFRLFVTNRGSATATRVRVRDFLPSGLTIVNTTTSRGRCAGTVCFLGRMDPGDRATVDVEALAGDDTGGRRLRDVATVRGRERERTLRNNVDSARVRIVPLVDLEVSKITATPTVPAGNQVSWDVVVHNNGPSTATHVQLTDTLPAPLTLVSAQPLQGSCTGLTCDLGTLASGASTQIVIVAASPPSVAGQTLTNLARAKAAEPEQDFGNNQATSDVSFTAPAPGPSPDVVVTKTADTPQVSVGGEVTYRITATNRGGGTAESVILTDTPDPGLLVTSVTPSQGTCSSGSPVSCDVGPLGPGASATVVVRARAIAAGTLRNGVTALPTTSGGDVAGISVASRARVTLRKRASRRVVRPGGHVTFRLTATARGTGAARNVRVCDRIPRPLMVVDRGGASGRGNRLCWTISRLPAGRSRTFHVRVEAPASAAGRRITNVATLTARGQSRRRARARIRIAPIANACVAQRARIAC